MKKKKYMMKNCRKILFGILALSLLPSLAFAYDYGLPCIITAGQLDCGGSEMCEYMEDCHRVVVGCQGEVCDEPLIHSHYVSGVGSCGWMYNYNCACNVEEHTCSGTANCQPFGTCYYTCDEGYVWEVDECVLETPVCDSEHLNLCLTESDCLNAGGYWYNGICNASPPLPVYQYVDFEPTNFVASLKTNVLELADDLMIPLVLMISLPIAFWFISKAVSLVQGGLRDKKD
jgi:hypothetical protein